MDINFLQREFLEDQPPVGQCPDCKLPWGIGPKCQVCGLDIEDLRAAANFFSGAY